MQKKIKTIFVGTPEFSVPTLRSLIESDLFDVIAVITQPDKKVGRKQQLLSPPVKILAEEQNIKVFQPEKIMDTYLEIKDDPLYSDLDLIVVIAYSQIISKEILSFPRLGCINVHGSLLPKYRGASCVQAAILSGDQESGITIMKMDEGLDTGPIIEKTETKLDPNITSETLYEKLSKLSGENIVEALSRYISGETKATPQSGTSSYMGTLKKEDGKINWDQAAENVERHIRAMWPWPKAHSILDNGKKIIISPPTEIVKSTDKEVSTIFVQDDKLLIQCADAALSISEIQIEGKRSSTAKEFINGHSGLLNKKLK